MEIRVIVPMIITAILIVCGFIFNKSKFIFTMQIIWMWVIIAFNSGGVDYKVYTQMFDAFSVNSNIFSATDPLYHLFCFYSKSIGWDFVMMNIALTTLALCLYFCKTKKLTKRVGIVGSLLLIYPLMENVIQKRNFLASSFVILAFSYLFSENKSKKKIFVILILIAAQVHSSAYVYLIFLFLQDMDTKKLKNVLKIVLPIAFLAIPIIPKIASLFFSASKVNLYFYQLKTSIFDCLCWIFLQVIFTMLIAFIHKQAPKKLSEEDFKLEEKVYKMNLILLIFLPLYYYEPTFVRIYRNLMIFNYIVIANRQSRITTKNNFAITFGWVVYVLAVYLVVYVLTGIGYSKLVLPCFTNNIFLNWILGG